MKKFFFLPITVIFFSLLLSAQEDPYKAIVDEMPEPVGGYEGIYKKIKYPENAVKWGLEGKVYLLVYINEKGGVDDVKIIKGIGGGCEESAVVAVKSTKFSPGKFQGTPTKVKLTVPVTFKIK